MLQPKTSPGELAVSHNRQSGIQRGEMNRKVRGFCDCKTSRITFYLCFLIFTEDLFECFYSVAILEIKGRM